MKFIFAIIPILGFIFYLHKKKISIFLAPMITFSLIIFISYWFAIFNLLALGFYILIALGLIAFFVYFPAIFIKIRQNFDYKDLVILAYLIPFIVILYSVPPDYRLSFWDEFADWGMSIKYMIKENKLYSFLKLDYFNYGHYPPAQQLFQYYFLKIVGWSESNLMFIELILLLGIQVSFFTSKKRQYFFGALGFIASTTIIFYFHFFYNNIYVDAFLGFYFAATFLYVMQSKNTWFDNFICCLMLFVLVQIKQVGALLAGILICTYFVKIVFSQISRQQLDWYFRPLFFRNHKAKNDSESSTIFPFFFLLTSVGSVFLSYGSWTFFKKINGVVSNKTESIPSLIKFFENPLSDRIRDTTHLFIIRLTEASYAIGIRFYILIIILILIGAFITLVLNKKDRLTQFLMILIIGFGAIFYFLFTLFAYILFFSLDEGIVLSGFERYTAIYFIAWVFILFGYLNQYTLTNKINKTLYLVVCILLLFISPPHDFYQIIHNNKMNPNILDDRKKIDTLISSLPSLEPASKVFFLAQESGGFIHRVFQYSMLPALVSNGCHSFIGPKSAPDVEACNSSFESAIRGYDYLVVYHANQDFWQNNRFLFAPDSQYIESGVFTITQTNKKILISKIHH